MILPPEEKGYDVGTLLVHSIIAEGLDNRYACRSVYLTLTIRNTEIEQETEVSNLFPPRWLEQKSKNDPENRLELAVFRRYRTSLIITVRRKGIFGIYHTVGTAEYWLRNIKDCRETEVEIPIFESLPKCFPASDIVESSQNTNESQEINIPTCESPITDIKYPETFLNTYDPSQRKKDSKISVGSLHDSSLITQEKELTIASERAIKTAVCSTNVIPPEEVGESSQKSQIDEKSGQKNVKESDSHKPNADEVSIIAQLNESNNNKPPNNTAESLDILTLENNNKNKGPVKFSEEPNISSEKPALSISIETLPASNPSMEKSTISILERETSSEVSSNISQELSATTENIASDAVNENSEANLDFSEAKGFLRFKVYFRPGLSLVHENDVKRSLTGANASILYQNPFCTMEDIEEQQNRLRERRKQATDMYRERSIPSGENYETETGQERRINRVHRRRTMRQLQWAKDLVKAKVISMSGKREWEDQEIIEHEV